MADSRDIRGREQGTWRRWSGYAVGILIEVTAVVTISLIALLILLVVKAIMT